MKGNLIRKQRVSIAAGATREETVRKALDIVKDDILAKIRGRVLIKPNFLSSVKHLAATQAGAVRPILEFLRDNGVDLMSVVIGEGASRSTRQAYDNFGYRELAKEFNIELVDLNHNTFSRSFELFTETRGIHAIEYSDIAANAETIISVAVAKTHDVAVATLSLKNMMGCLRRVKRPRMHGIQLGSFAELAGEKMWNVIEDHSWIIKLASAFVFKIVHIHRLLEKHRHKGASPGFHSQVRAMAENIVRLGEVLMPDIAVIDGFEAMEGEGPGGGTPVNMGIAVAGTDPVACDAVMAHLMGFDPLSIGYLNLADKKGMGIADLSKIDCAGENLSNHIHHIKPHSNYPVQLKWCEAWIQPS
ncbi:DUF362 domain-containing protein [Candidatus Latescibacterota bacterium]